MKTINEGIEMEDKIYKNNFEQFLRDTTDDFLMVPSRKVWYGIYNNMHPDRKWPSMAVCLLILSSVLYLGVSNNNSLSGAARRSAAENLSDLAKIYISEKNAVASYKPSSGNRNGSQQLYSGINSTTRIPLASPGNSTVFSDLLYAENSVVPVNIDSRSSNNSTAIAEVYNSEPDGISPETGTSEISVSNRYPNAGTTEKFTKKQNENLTVSGLNADKKITSDIAVNESDNALPNDIKEAVSFSADKKTNNITTAEKTARRLALENEKSWREDYAFRNKPKMTKFRERASISYYFTPSIGFRSFTQIRENEITVTSLRGWPGAVSTVTEMPVDKSGWNLEAGAAVLYNLSENIRLKSGLQANYINYTSGATYIGHPTQTELAVNNADNRLRSSVFSASPGSDRLNKSTLQVSMPLGADIKIAGNHKIKWYIGATLQPTYIMNGSAYVMSADEKYYIAEKSLLRKWNMNTAVETFVSFKPSPAVTLTVGPQFRYQLLSSFNKEYNYSEKLYNTGLKVGIITGL